MNKMGERLFAMAGTLSSMVTAFVLATPLLVVLVLLVGCLFGCFACWICSNTSSTPEAIPVPQPTATLVAPTATRQVHLTPAHLRHPVTAPTIGGVYDVPWGSMLCEVPGDASLDWLEPQYCGNNSYLDVLDQGVTLTGSEGAWCYVEGEYMSLDGIKPQEGWVACRFLSTP